MEKTILINIFIIHALIVVGYATSLHPMYTQDDELSDAIELRMGFYKPELQRKEQGHDNSEKEQSEQCDLEQLQIKELICDRVGCIQKTLKSGKKEFNCDQQMQEDIKLQEQEGVYKPKIYAMTQQELLDTLNANAVVVVNNVNVPIEAINLLEFMGPSRKGIARSEVGALWDIPININKNPFLFFIIAHAQRYVWKIKSFKTYSLELGLIEESTFLGPRLELAKIYEGSMIPKSHQCYIDCKVIKPFNILKIK